MSTASAYPPHAATSALSHTPRDSTNSTTCSDSASPPTPIITGSTGQCAISISHPASTNNPGAATIVTTTRHAAPRATTTKLTNSTAINTDNGNRYPGRATCCG